MGEPTINIARMQEYKSKTSATHVAGVGSLLRANKVEVINGKAKLLPSKQVEVETSAGQKMTLQAQKIIIATGAKPIRLPIPGADSPNGVFDAGLILNVTSPPKSLLMIGGGVIGLEMTIVLTRLGCKVTVVEMLPHILPLEDAEIVAVVHKALQDEGVQIYTNAKVTKIEDVPGGKACTVVAADGEKKIEAEQVAIAVGYRPNTDGMGFEEAGIAMVKGRIQTNEKMETSVPGIYAAGDCVGKIMLAYIAMTEGEVAAENAMGKNKLMSYAAVPRCVYTQPEVGAVGLTEEDAIKKGYQIKVGRYPFMANAMATILGERKGLVKMIVDAKYGQFLGVHIVGPHATELIAEATLAMKMDFSPTEILATIHSHPSLAEAVKEAALDITGETIHMPPKKR